MFAINLLDEDSSAPLINYIIYNWVVHYIGKEVNNDLITYLSDRYTKFDRIMAMFYIRKINMVAIKITTQEWDQIWGVF